VHGISSGLSYLEDKRYPLEYVEPTDFDLLIGDDGNLKLCFKRNSLLPSDCDMDAPDSPAQTQQRHAALELLDNLCRRAFKDANRQLYRDEVDRMADVAPDSLIGSHSTVNLDSSLGQRSPSEASISIGSAGRRELVWKSSDKSATLAEVSEQVEEFLFSLRTAHTKRIIRHYVSSGRSKSHHRCPGYSREEIILGSQAHSTVIVSHSTPSPREVCTVCGHIVEDGGWFKCSCGKPDDGLEPTTNCTACNSWHHVQCLCIGGLLTPNMKDLKTALQNNQVTVEHTPGGGHPADLAGHFQRLAVTLAEQYRSSGDVRDLEAALQAAVEQTPEGHLDLDSLPVSNQIRKIVASTFGGYRLVQLVNRRWAVL
ncbi:hypothetical protein C8J57DRAFT_316598, partial [Mycena rebaudengoi]